MKHYVLGAVRPTVGNTVGPTTRFSGRDPIKLVAQARLARAVFASDGLGKNEPIPNVDVLAPAPPPSILALFYCSWCPLDAKLLLHEDGGSFLNIENLF